MNILRYVAKIMLAVCVIAAIEWPIICHLEGIPQYGYWNSYAVLGAALLSLFLFMRWQGVPARVAQGAHAARPHVVYAAHVARAGAGRGARAAGNGIAAGARFSWPYVAAAGKWVGSWIAQLFMELLIFSGEVLGLRHGARLGFAGWFLLFASLATILYPSPHLGRTFMYLADIRVTYGTLLKVAMIGGGIAVLGFFLSFGDSWVRRYRRYESPLRRRIRNKLKAFRA